MDWTGLFAYRRQVYVAVTLREGFLMSTRHSSAGRRSLSILVATVVAASGLLVLAGPAAAVPYCTGTTVRGTVAVGQVLTAVPTYIGLADKFGAYWARLEYSGTFTPIGTNTATYAPTEQDFGHVLRVNASITSVQDDFFAICPPVITTTVGRVATPVSGAPVVVGQAKKGRTVVAAVGVPPAETSVTYQWLRIKKVRKKLTTVVIPGAIAFSYKLRKKDKGKRIACRVTYSRPGYLPTTLTTASRKVK